MVILPYPNFRIIIVSNYAVMGSTNITKSQLCGLICNNYIQEENRNISRTDLKKFLSGIRRKLKDVYFSKNRIKVEKR